MLESLLATNAQTPKDARRTTATMAKPVKEEEKKDTVPQRRRRLDVVVMGMLWQLPALCVLRLCASHKVPPRGSVCACFCLRIAFSGVAGRALFVFVLSAQQKSTGEGRERRGEKAQLCGGETPLATVRPPLLFYVECN